LWSFVGHGAAGTGEPLSVLLRPGNAPFTATDHIAEKAIASFTSRPIPEGARLSRTLRAWLV
jgi:hypothetical protein